MNNTISSFVDLRVMYNTNEERKIENLSSLYNDRTILYKTIKSLIDDHINESEIRNKVLLLKPNWVRHNEKKSDELCLCTNENFILTTVEVVLQKQPKFIIIGDAPIQGCIWPQLLSDKFYKNVMQLSKRYDIPITIYDFRRVTFDPLLNKSTKERRPLSEYLIFDLGKDSHLEPISTNENIFRVTSYNPDRLAESHKKGIHKYCITKKLFEADTIISLPKVKTHQKAGITCALKNLVGLNGDKDYLPHHRIGGTEDGGDCYPGKNILRSWSEHTLDAANRRQGKKLYKFLTYTSAILWKLSNPKKTQDLAAGWYGNDTTWRMVLDLNRIAVYGKADGTISQKPQRNVYSLCDGIIGGQGNGPLKPEPLPLGVISLTNNSGLNDICIATLMGFDYKKIPLLTNLKINLSLPDKEFFIDGKTIGLEDLKKYCIKTLPPPGWIDYLK